jgi:hypothetical protein
MSRNHGASYFKFPYLIFYLIPETLIGPTPAEERKQCPQVEIKITTITMWNQATNQQTKNCLWVAHISLNVRHIYSIPLRKNMKGLVWPGKSKYKWFSLVHGTHKIWSYAHFSVLVTGLFPKSCLLYVENMALGYFKYQPVKSGNYKPYFTWINFD